MEVDDLLGLAFHEVEVKSYLSLDFRTVKQEKNLRFNSSIEEKLKLWSRIAVDLDVGERSSLLGEVVVISFNLFAHWVPLCVEVNASILWSLVVEILDDFIHTFWLDPILVRIADHGSYTGVKKRAES